MIDRDPYQYVESFQATPFPSASPLQAYTSAQLEFFEEGHDLRPEINDGVHQLHDRSTTAEVGCYHATKKGLA